MKRNMFILALSIAVLFSAVATGFADESAIFNSPVSPNVLFILDESNSMDEDFIGNAVGSYLIPPATTATTQSKSVVARTTLTSIVNTYAGQINMGLMTFRLPGAPLAQNLSNSAYFSSYDPRSYCSNFYSLPQATQTACNNYCIQGDTSDKNICQAGCGGAFDASYALLELFLPPAAGAAPLNGSLRTTYCPLVYPRTISITNPTSTSNNIYYKQALPYYGSGTGNEFDYSPGYSIATQSAGAGQGPYNNYDRYSAMTGSSDLETGYSGGFGSTGFVPSDSDVALGYLNFGQRMFSYFIGQTWFVNSSPGNGFLNLPVASVTGTQQSTLLSLLGSVDNQANYMSGSYSSTWNASCTNSGNQGTCHIINAGLTPTAGTFESAYDYFKGTSDYLNTNTLYTSPIAYQCQQNFIVFVTDGLPSTDENGNSSSTSAALLPNVKTRIGNLRQSGGFTYRLGGTSYPFDIQTYVLGEGLSSGDKVLLDQMAVAGGTDVGGHAYYADNPQQLVTGLSSVLTDIISKSYSFTTTSVSSSRITDENYLYEASFQPTNADPFWRGDVVKYNINNDGSIGSAVWHAGTLLQSAQSSSRKIYTYKGGAMVAFNTTNILTTDLNVSTSAQQNQVVGYVRGDSSYNPEIIAGEPGPWKLGDIFHSNIVTIGTPSSNYSDTLDRNFNSSGQNAFAQFRANNPRTSANGLRVLIGGANDGQFHVFKAQDGSETWSFVPPNVLQKLQYLAHASNPSTLSHQYFADGPVVVADAWLGSGNGTPKNSSDWHTMAILSVGKSDLSGYPKPYWSSSPSCDSGFYYPSPANSTVYSASYPYYCGYYAFDFTNTVSPTFQWMLAPTSTVAPYIGEPWGKMAIGKIRLSGSEKWVGFIGGGYPGTCVGSSSSPCANQGKSFLVVDLSNGTILWSYTASTNSSMGYSLAGSPAIIDSDSDGFIDTVYIGDMGNNMWRFNLCTSSMGSSCSTANWTGGIFYSSSAGDVSPVYATPTVARDGNGSIWVYWGTGDKVNPTVPTTNDNMYAVKDDRVSTFTKGNLLNVTSTGATYSNTTTSSSDGWYIKFATGEKMLSDPAVFGSVLYFSTYTPPPSSANVCTASGVGTAYGVNYVSAAGSNVAGAGTGRVVATGLGLATSPIVSLGPVTTGSNGTTTSTSDLYINFSGGPGSNSQLVHEGGIPDTATRNRVLFWRDQRIK